MYAPNIISMFTYLRKEILSNFAKLVFLFFFFKVVLKGLDFVGSKYQFWAALTHFPGDCILHVSEEMSEGRAMLRNRAEEKTNEKKGCN
jgi:hypothetical protein